MRFGDLWKFAGANKQGMRWYECLDKTKVFKDKTGEEFPACEVLLIDSQVEVEFYGIVPKTDILKSHCVNVWRRLSEAPA